MLWGTKNGGENKLGGGWPITTDIAPSESPSSERFRLTVCLNWRKHFTISIRKKIKGCDALGGGWPITTDSRP